MAGEIGNTIGQRLQFALDKAVRKGETVAVAIIAEVFLDRMKCDVVLKSTVHAQITRICACPIKSMSYGHSALVVVPKVGDLVMIEYNRKFLEKLLKSGSLKCNKLGEYETYYDQYAIVTGIIFPIPERENMGEVDEIDSKVLSRATRPPRPGSGQEKYFMRNPIAHSESVENAKLFIQERMCPEEGDIILYHGNDHEIRLNEREIHLKHRTGSQIIFRENGDIDVYAFRNFHVHAQGNVEINGVIGASLNGDMPKKNRPYRIVT